VDFVAEDVDIIGCVAQGYAGNMTLSVDGVDVVVVDIVIVVIHIDSMTGAGTGAHKIPDLVVMPAKGPGIGIEAIKAVAGGVADDSVVVNFTAGTVAVSFDPGKKDVVAGAHGYLVLGYPR